MRITSKGQATLPVEVREKAGPLPHTEVSPVLDGTAACIFPVERPKGETREQAMLRHWAGRGAVSLSTDEILALTRDA
nr:AbrB/MazE/SpoVT family DNA-binding domain-containing protein [uncultured Holophaga sp.]